MVVVYAIAAWLAPWSPKRGLGLAFGILAALVFVFEMAYPYRRSRARPLGTARALDAGPRLPRARWPSWPCSSTPASTARAAFMGWALFLLSALDDRSAGWSGSGCRSGSPRRWPRACAWRRSTSASRPWSSTSLKEADDLVANGERGARALLPAGGARRAWPPSSPSWAYLLDVRAGRERALEPFRRMSAFVRAGGEGKIVNDLMTIRMEKMELDAHYSLQGVLRRWLVAATCPPAAVLMALLVVHVLAWVLY